MPLVRRRPRPALPAAAAAHVPAGDRPLGVVPVSPDGATWALASARALVVVGAHGMVSRDPWDAVDRGAWDNGPRTFTLVWVEAARPDTVLTVPEELDGVVVDVADFARALRQRVEAAIVHRVTGSLPDGGVATVSVRRHEDGRLYTSTVLGVSPGRAAAGGVDGAVHLSGVDTAALAELERRARDGVGLPTT